jgi:hypothetical protein
VVLHDAMGATSKKEHSSIHAPSRILFRKILRRIVNGNNMRSRHSPLDQPRIQDRPLPLVRAEQDRHDVAYLASDLSAPLSLI